MRSEYKKIPMVIEKKEYCPEGANHPTLVTVYQCFCGKGTVEHHRVPGFNDEYFEICCEACDGKYAHIEQCGREWLVDLC